ncbi:hypothetical protein [Pontibacter beigongshangensis]|uniref:hypothetical protein n=1 Tax=Pontibacter beigongshangensis TaxID=2574733 RepID=UPI00164F0124|nr:hypothetical protein [Pontibacter beigongshangensis]
MVISSTPVANIEYWSEIEALFISWISTPDIQSFKKVYNLAFDFVAEHKEVRLFCADQTRSGAFGPEHEAWLLFDFNSRVYSLLQEDIYVAVVFTEDHFNAIVNNYQLYRSDSQPNFIHFNYFTRLQEAQLWLQAIKKGQDKILS